VSQRKITMKFPLDEGDAFLAECELAGVFPAQRVRSMRRLINEQGLADELPRHDAQVKAEGRMRCSEGGSRSRPSPTKK
jgi:hypothetical protein